MFRPYHNFENCSRLERLVVRFRGTGNLSAEVKNGYEQYHVALLYKLQCAKRYIQELSTELARSVVKDAAAETEKVMLAVNFNFDGFLYASGSALDILAREVLTYYGQQLTGNIYYLTACNVISASHPANAILPLLDDPTWKPTFSNYRNAATHERMLMVGGALDFSVRSGGVEFALNVPLPPDPFNPLQTSTQRAMPTVLDYAKRTFKQELSLINRIYGEIVRQARAAGGLPL